MSHHPTTEDPRDIARRAIRRLRVPAMLADDVEMVAWAAAQAKVDRGEPQLAGVAAKMAGIDFLGRHGPLSRSKALRPDRAGLSLDAPLSPDSPVPFADVTPHPGVDPGPILDTEHAQMIRRVVTRIEYDVRDTGGGGQSVANARSRRARQHARVLRGLLLGQTLTAIADELDLSVARISQIASQARERARRLCPDIAAQFHALHAD